MAYLPEKESLEEQLRKDLRKTKQKEITVLANKILTLAHDDILIHLRFFDMALANLKWEMRESMGCLATDGRKCYYDPVYILRAYQQEPKYITRCYLHLLLHCIFSHNFQYNKLETDLWDLAADIAVENVILDMKLPCVALEQDGAVEYDEETNAYLSALAAEYVFPGGLAEVMCEPTARGILQSAIRSEQESIAFYTKMSQAAYLDSARRRFQEIADTERAHLESLQVRLDQVSSEK